MCYRFRCKTSAVSSSISISDVSITVNRIGSTETVVMTNRFRYDVSYDISNTCNQVYAIEKKVSKF